MKKIKGITVRRANLEDTRELLSMSYAFFLEQMEAPEKDFNSKDVMSQIVDYITGPNSDILIAENGTGPVGTIAMHLAPAYYNHSVKVATDHHFFIDPEYRNSSVVKRLISAAREWAMRRECIWLRGKIYGAKRYKIQKFKGGA